MITAWSEPLEGVFPTRAKEDGEKIETFSFAGRSAVSPAVKTARPKVFIPVFPGTNCEMDSKRAFERAGGEVEMQILANLTPEVLDESIHQMAKKIRQSQIIMIPGDSAAEMNRMVPQNLSRRYFGILPFLTRLPNSWKRETA